MSDAFYEIDTCITAPQGFLAGTTACGIKADPSIQDLAMLASDVPCVAAGTFTTSSTRAAPVLLCQERLKSGKAQALIVNSGNANCTTGQQGMHSAYRMTELAAAHLGIDDSLVLCSSTGIIGYQLPIEKIETGVKHIVLSKQGGKAFSEAILTTDTYPKCIGLEFELDGRTIRLGGVSKGSGMIYPNMATMLCYLTTDAAIEADWLQSELRTAVADSFNMICVDGAMSTNDTCVLLANGLACNRPLNASHPEVGRFQAALRYITSYLAREIARDGEGATKLMTVHVNGACNKDDAVRAARAITRSVIWQCALAGSDPNWGRIVAALGASGCALQQDRFDIFLGDVQVVKQGMAAAYDQQQAQSAMAGREVAVTIDLHLGHGEATAWGCDLTHGYIDENSLYTR
jgi:glutamate N-acetyltransferase / amino-acid N-acetyltransferase